MLVSVAGIATKQSLVFTYTASETISCVRSHYGIYVVYVIFRLLSPQIDFIVLAIWGFSISEVYR